MADHRLNPDAPSFNQNEPTASPSNRAASYSNPAATSSNPAASSFNPAAASFQPAPAAAASSFRNAATIGATNVSLEDGINQSNLSAAKQIMNSRRTVVMLYERRTLELEARIRGVSPPNAGRLLDFDGTLSVLRQRRDHRDRFVRVGLSSEWEVKGALRRHDNEAISFHLDRVGAASEQLQRDGLRMETEIHIAVTTVLNRPEHSYNYSARAILRDQVRMNRVLAVEFCRASDDLMRATGQHGLLEQGGDRTRALSGREPLDQVAEAVECRARRQVNERLTRVLARTVPRIRRLLRREELLWRALQWSWRLEREIPEAIRLDPEGMSWEMCVRFAKEQEQFAHRSDRLMQAYLSTEADSTIVHAVDTATHTLNSATMITATRSQNQRRPKVEQQVVLTSPDLEGFEDQEQLLSGIGTQFSQSGVATVHGFGGFMHASSSQDTRRFSTDELYAPGSMSNVTENAGSSRLNSNPSSRELWDILQKAIVQLEDSREAEERNADHDSSAPRSLTNEHHEHNPSCEGRLSGFARRDRIRRSRMRRDRQRRRQVGVQNGSRNCLYNGVPNATSAATEDVHPPRWAPFFAEPLAFLQDVRDHATNRSLYAAARDAAPTWRRNPEPCRTQDLLDNSVIEGPPGTCPPSGWTPIGTTPRRVSAQNRHKSDPTEDELWAERTLRAANMS